MLDCHVSSGPADSRHPKTARRRSSAHRSRSSDRGFIVNYYEYHFLYIAGIEHVESKSIQGVGLIKLQFHPGTNMAQATAETVAYVDRARAFMPTGTVPPFVMRFDGGSVPVGDLVFSSKTKTVAELQDAALFKVRPLFATLPAPASGRRAKLDESLVFAKPIDAGYLGEPSICAHRRIAFSFDGSVT